MGYNFCLLAIHVVILPGQKQNPDRIVLCVSVAIASGDGFVELNLRDLLIKTEKARRHHLAAR
jgi:hypothetical protein